ncbi:transcription antitermination protein NusB [Trueperella bialowiezensis]|uniref:N utilization substance protein B homolog n=1 Tax=Trueperella bialowiezensis TaxID=312285 RepID=A0A448PBU5_9ACTO|nr:transcription antitermination protein NusB [Trueperella bialowiezensis]VEI12449.1 N utilization substance protein B homolog [Trueperella bialowiezensis]
MARRNPDRKGRSLQRQKALDVLYEADLRERDVHALLEERKTISTNIVPIGDYGITIVQTYADNAPDVDSMIEAASPDWSLARMSTVDRNLLRLGATELMFLGIDVPIVVSEIKGLARDLSSDSSVGFTMGVLNRVGEIRDAETAGLGTVVTEVPVTPSPEDGDENGDNHDT